MAGQGNAPYFDVAILGGGLSGLAVADHLVRNCEGIKVVLCEARARLGGRTKTVEGLDGQARVDMGGAWLGDSHETMLSLCKQYGIPLLAQEYPPLLPVLSKAGSTASVPARRVLDLCECVNFSGGGAGSEEEDEELQKFVDSIEEMAKRINCSAPWAAPFAADADSMTAEEYIDLNVKGAGGARREAKLYVQTVLACDPSQCSLLFFVFYVASGGGVSALGDGDHGAQRWRLQSGTGHLVAAWAHDLHTLGLELRLSFKAESVTLTDGARHHEIRPASGESLRCGRVVVAMSPMVASRVRFQPSLGPEVEQLQARMVGGSCIKVVVAYQQAFWLAQRERDGARDPHVTLLGPAHNVFHSSAGGLPALVCLITGSHAAGSSASGGFDGDDSANPLGGEKSSGGHELPPGGSGHAGACVAGARRCLRDRVLQQVRSMYCNDLALQPEMYLEEDWCSKTQSRGCFSGSYPPGLMTEVRDAARRQRGSVHFASTEAAERFYGYMEGAVLAGKRCAEEAGIQWKDHQQRQLVAGT